MRRSTYAFAGASLVLALSATPAQAAPTPTPSPSSTASPTSPSSTASPSSSSTPASPTSSASPTSKAIPPFPGFDATEAQLQAWATAVGMAYNLPNPPSETAPDAAWAAYMQQVMNALGSPSQDASPTAWAAWLKQIFGISIADILDSLGSDAYLSDGYCTSAGGRVDISAVNLASKPTFLRPLLDNRALSIKISLAGSSLSADEPATYDGSLSVPNGHHVVSIMDASGTTLDSVTTHLQCRVSGSGQLVARPASQAMGPKVQTDYAKAENSLTGVGARDEALLGGAVLASLALAIRRFARN